MQFYRESFPWVSRKKIRQSRSDQLNFIKICLSSEALAKADRFPTWAGKIYQVLVLYNFLRFEPNLQKITVL